MKKLLFIIFICFVTIQAGCTPPDSVKVNKDIPSEVTKGQSFDFIITVNNEDSKAHELRSIDIDDDFLDGILIVSTTPITVEEYGTWGQHIFEFKQDIPESSSYDVIFHAKAIDTGDYSGDLDICIDGDASCLFNSIRILVN
jgi:hypothetical protein